MRIIAGSAKKRVLSVPRGWTGRPTADRVKESLFNILGERVVESRFLDIFAGTGNVGIEALSRGARRAVFVEQDRRAAEAIKKNLDLTGFTGHAMILKQDAITAVNSLAATRELFDLIFLDPPYCCGYEANVISGLSRLELLAPGGLIVAESSKREELPSTIGKLIMFRREKYGDTILSFFACQSGCC